MKNKFCNSKDLGNEATVEARFVDRLLDHLGFSAPDLKLKTSLRELKVGKGSKSSLYKPDYVILSNGMPTVIVDAKATTESITDYEQQCSSYCLEINKAYDHNPVKYYLLSNGFKTNLYAWDAQKPILELEFQNFVDGDSLFEALLKRIGKNALAEASEKQMALVDNAAFQFNKTSLHELGELFQRMHQYIWAKEKKSPSAAFEELMKIVFVKIKKDREIHAKFGSSPKPKYKDVVFSTHWINSQTENESPINDPLFRNLVTSLEVEITNDKKKRVFDENEQIKLSRDTIKWIVKELQHIDFVSMEEDIHGRMFETFLNATVRGRDLGQFFTPRDIVDLMVDLSQIEITKAGGPKILDACCGSGGFLISAMGRMITQANALVGITTKERNALTTKIKNELIFGIDAGSDPAIYRIARMNMYLHGDGGSHIYHADSLDKALGSVGNASIEYNKQLEEVRQLIIGQQLKFDVILSNPPFSLKYSRDDAEQEHVLNQYSISVDKTQGKILKSLLSSVMFLERYKDLVSEDGQILAVIDDSVLSGASYAHVREYIRDQFIVVGVISLPGDAFRRASARVKTSILVLRLRKDGEVQSDVFMASSVCLGIEEKTARRIGLDSATLPLQKEAEAKKICKDFVKYLSGKRGSYSVPASQFTDRMDVKFCISDGGRKIPLWTSKKLAVCSVEDVLSLASNRDEPVVETDSYQFLRVNYDGDITEGELIEGAECSYSTLFKVERWDILMSNMGVGRGAVGIVPPFHAGKFVSNEYTILRAKSEEEAVYYCNLLRTKEILGDILASTTGMNRGRIKWDSISTVKIPKYVTGNVDIKSITADLKDYWKSFERYWQGRMTHMAAVAADLDIEGPGSQRRWLAFKPPE
jgi:type I restriction enzyme M protein